MGQTCVFCERCRLAPAVRGGFSCGTGQAHRQWPPSITDAPCSCRTSIDLNSRKSDTGKLRGVTSGHVCLPRTGDRAGRPGRPGDVVVMRGREAMRPGHGCPVGRRCPAEEPGRGQVAGALNTSVPGHCPGNGGRAETAASEEPCAPSRRLCVAGRHAGGRGGQTLGPGQFACVNVVCDALPAGLYWFSLD